MTDSSEVRCQVIRQRAFFTQKKEPRVTNPRSFLFRFVIETNRSEKL